MMTDIMSLLLLALCSCLYFSFLSYIFHIILINRFVDLLFLASRQYTVRQLSQSSGCSQQVCILINIIVHYMAAQQKPVYWPLLMK